MLAAQQVDAQRGVEDEIRALLVLGQKLSDNAGKQLAATKAVDTATKAVARERDAADARRRSVEKRHAQEIVRLSQPRIQYAYQVRVVEPPKPERV